MIYDAVVIGAGPAGATAARCLAEAGWSVALVEKAEFPRRKVCGEFISAATLPLLGSGAIRDSFLAQAGPEIRRVGLYANGAALASPMPRSDVSAPWGRALGREHLDCLLRDGATHAGAALFQPYKLASMERAGDGFACTLKCPNGSITLIARNLIAACGSWEPSPFKPASIPHRDRDFFAFKAHFRDSELPADLMPLLMFPGGYGGMVQTDAGRVSLSCCITRRELGAARRTFLGSAAEAVIAHIEANAEGVARALARAKPDGAYLSAGPIRPGIRARYADGIFFAGNLAGEAHPIIAEGISMAIQGATLLAHALTKEGGVPIGTVRDDAGRFYAQAWRRHFATRIHAAALFAQVAARPRLRAIGVPMVERFPNILTLGAWISGKVNGLAVPSPNG